MLYSCTHMATAGVKWLNKTRLLPVAALLIFCLISTVQFMARIHCIHWLCWVRLSTAHLLKRGALTSTIIHQRLFTNTSRLAPLGSTV